MVPLALWDQKVQLTLKVPEDLSLQVDLVVLAPQAVLEVLQGWSLESLENPAAQQVHLVQWDLSVQETQGDQADLSHLGQKEGVIYMTGYQVSIGKWQ